MRKLLSLGVVGLFIGMTAVIFSSQVRAAGSVRDHFVGAWRLAWLEEQGADGKIHRADCSGLLVYTRDGHMSVQVMYRNTQAAAQPANSPAPVQYAQGGMRHRLVPIRSTNTLIPSTITSTARSCEL